MNTFKLELKVVSIYSLGFTFEDENGNFYATLGNYETMRNKCGFTIGQSVLIEGVIEKIAYEKGIEYKHFDLINFEII